MTNDIERVKDLEKVGFSRKQAEAQVKTMNDGLKNFVTKDYLDTKLAEFRAEVQAEFARVRLEIVELRGKIIVLEEKIEWIPFRTLILMWGSIISTGVACIVFLKSFPPAAQWLKSIFTQTP
jgi:DNA-binding transcriptional MerR regulator